MYLLDAIIYVRYNYKISKNVQFYLLKLFIQFYLLKLFIQFYLLKLFISKYFEWIIKRKNWKLSTVFELNISPSLLSRKRIVIKDARIISGKTISYRKVISTNEPVIHRCAGVVSTRIFTILFNNTWLPWLHDSQLNKNFYSAD